MSRAARPPFPLVLLRFWFVRILPVWCGIALLDLPDADRRQRHRSRQ